MGAKYVKLSYEGKLWQGETLANLANDHKFAKVSPANFSNAAKAITSFPSIMLIMKALQCACYSTSWINANN